jgi:acyl-CoA thioesterase FadM
MILLARRWPPRYQIVVRRRLKTRGYELDRRAKIPPATVLRYLEHLRWEAVVETPAVGETFERGHRLVVVAQRLLLRRELGLGDELELELWIERVGRSSLEFGHRIQLLGTETDAPIAEAQVTAVHLGPDGRPAPLSDAIRALCAPAGGLEGFPPPLPPEPPLVGGFAHRFPVRPSDLDLLQHVNHANYLTFAEDARELAAATEMLGPLGARPLRAVTLEYRRQALLGDELEARIQPLSETAFGFQLLRAGELLCSARSEV